MLARDADKALLISRYALDCRPYNLKRESVSWATCGLRTWLNNTFVNEAFNSWEKLVINSTTVTVDLNPKYSTRQGYETRDMVFLLSAAEAEKYFTSDAARACKPTGYAIRQGAYIPASISSWSWNAKPTDENCCWWLRTSGFSSEEATYVYPEGHISYSGDTVFRDSYAVRPAMWVDARLLLAQTPVPTASPTPDPTPTPAPTPIALPTAPSAQTVQSGDYSYVELSDGTVRITDYTGSVLHVEIPQTLDGKRVTSIGAEAFWGAFGQTIVIPDGVTDLGGHSFSRIEALKEITLPASLRYIDSLAFSDCEGLLYITIPEGVTTLKYEVFEGSGVSVLYLPSTLTEIDEYALQDAESLRVVHLADGMTHIPKNLCRQVQSIECIVIPDTVTEIGAYFGYDCPKLKCVYVPAGVTRIEGGALAQSDQLTVYVHEGSAAHQYCVDERINYHLVRPVTNADFEYQLLEDGTACITRYLGTSPDVMIPASLDGYPVTAIGERAFYTAYILQHLTIPEGVTIIGNSAFDFCESLIEVHLPDTLVSIGDSAFASCNALTSIELPDGLREIGKRAFGSSLSLQSITIPGSVEYIGESAFSSCYCLSSITMEEGVKSIGLNAFYGTPWKTLTIGEGTTRIGKAAFHARYARPVVRCNLPASLQNIQNDIFSGTFNQNADALCTVVKGSFAEWYCKEKLIAYTCIPGLDLTGSMADSTLPAAQHGVDNHLTLGSLQVDIPAGFSMEETEGNTFSYTASISRSSVARLTLSYVGAPKLGPVSADLSSFGTEANVLAGLVWFDYQLDNGMWLSRAVAAQHDYYGERRSVAAAVISDGETAVLIVCSYLTNNEQVALDYVDTVLSGTIRISDVPPPTATPAPTPSPVEVFFGDTKVIRMGDIEMSVPTGSSQAYESDKSTYNSYQYDLPDGRTMWCLISVGLIDGLIDQPPIHYSWEAREVLNDLVFEHFVEWGVHSFSPATYDLLQLDDNVYCARHTYQENKSAYSKLIVTDLTYYYLITISSSLGTDELCEDFLLRLRASIQDASKPAPTPMPTMVPPSIASEEDYEHTVLEDGTVCITKYLGMAEIVVVPQKINGRQVTVLGTEAFFDWEREATVRELTLPEGLRKIDAWALSSCENLERVYIPQSVTEIGSGAFSLCEKLVEVELPAGLTNIKSLLFDGCISLTHVKIPNGVTQIGSDAFYRCGNLVEVNIPDSVTTIKINPFTKCDKLRSIDISPDHPVFSFEDGVLFERETGKLISFLSDVASYTLPARTTEIAIGAFCGSQHLTHVVLNDFISEIPGSAFEYTGLTEMSLPDSVTKVGNYAFAGCQQLVRFEMSSNVTQIGESAFARCENLESITLPEGLERIDDYAFENCEALFMLDIPDTVTKLGYDVFEGCDALTVIVGAGTYAEAYCKENGVRYALRGNELNAATSAPTTMPTTIPTIAPTAVPTATLTAAPAAVSTAVPTSSAKHPIAGTTDTYQHSIQHASSSSHLVANSGVYDATKAVDGDETTCWQFSTKKSALGKAALDIALAPGSTVDEMWIKNGFWYINQGLDQYTRNSRPKQIGISFLYDGEQDYRDEVQRTLRDDKERKDWQKVILGRHEHVSAIRLRIISIYTGTKFKTDVAISEVMFVEREGGPAPIFYETLKRGSKGDDVLAMKERLQELGYFKQGAELSVSYNDTCAERVKQFQKVNGLPQTGIADHDTLTLLYSDAALPKN